jgi:cell division protease FtsH
MNGGENIVMQKDITEEEHYRVAVHEIGHALVQSRLFPNSAIKKITVNAEGTGALGYVEHAHTFGVQNTKSVYFNSITVKMAGLAAEEAVLGEYADGGSSDISSAAQTARAIITRCGMSENGFVVSENESEIVGEINKLMKEAFDKAKGMVEESREAVGRAVERLLAQGEITQEELEAILAQ